MQVQRLGSCCYGDRMASSAKEGHQNETDLGPQRALWLLLDKSCPLSWPCGKCLLSDRTGLHLESLQDHLCVSIFKPQGTAVCAYSMRRFFLVGFLMFYLFIFKILFLGIWELVGGGAVCTPQCNGPWKPEEVSRPFGAGGVTGSYAMTLAVETEPGSSAGVHTSNL